MSVELTAEQRRVRNSVMVMLCRGFYEECLETLRTAVPLPPLQGEILVGIVRRMMDPKPGEEIPQDHLNAIAQNKDIIQQLQGYGQDTSIGDSVVKNVYEKAMEASFKNFRNLLMQTQAVEHSKIHQALILFEASSSLLLAQQKIDKMGRCVWIGYNEVLFLFCVVLFLFTTAFIIQLRL